MAFICHILFYYIRFFSWAFRRRYRTACLNLLEFLIRLITEALNHPDTDVYCPISIALRNRLNQALQKLRDSDQQFLLFSWCGFSIPANDWSKNGSTTGSAPPSLSDDATTVSATTLSKSSSPRSNNGWDRLGRFHAQTLVPSLLHLIFL